MAVNHRYLIGKEIEYKGDFRKVKATVVHIDKDIGITIVNKYYKNEKLLCLNGPSTIEY